jgi:hypothetical protein
MIKSGNILGMVDLSDLRIVGPVSKLLAILE